MATEIIKLFGKKYEVDDNSFYEKSLRALSATLEGKFSSNKKLKALFGLSQSEIYEINEVKNFIKICKDNEDKFKCGTNHLINTNKLYKYITDVLCYNIALDKDTTNNYLKEKSEKDTLITESTKEQKIEENEKMIESEVKIKRKRKTKICRHLVIQAKLLINNKISIDEIAKKLEVSKTTIYRINRHEYDYLLTSDELNDIERLTTTNIDNFKETAIIPNNKSESAIKHSIDDYIENNCVYDTIDFSEYNLIQKGRKNIHKCGLVANRHEITQVNKYIFEQSLPDASEVDFDQMKETVRKYIKTNSIDSNYKIMLYATGLQSAIMAVTSVCFEEHIDLVVMHYSHKNKMYYPQNIFQYDKIHHLSTINSDEIYSIEKESEMYKSDIIFEATIKLQNDGQIIYSQTVLSANWNEILDIYIKMTKHIIISDYYAQIFLYKYERPKGFKSYKNRSHLATGDNFLYYSRRNENGGENNE